MNVCLIATGYVGLVTGACPAHLGHEVVCVDVDARKVEMLKAGRSPIYEPGVEVYDPLAMNSFREAHPELDLVYAPEAGALAEGCDAPVLVTEWAEFARLDLGALRRRVRGALLVDGRNVFDPDEARSAGFDYAGVGR